MPFVSHFAINTVHFIFCAFKIPFSSPVRMWYKNKCLRFWLEDCRKWQNIVFASHSKLLKELERGLTCSFWYLQSESYFNRLKDPFLPSIRMAAAKLQNGDSLHFLGLKSSFYMKWKMILNQLLRLALSILFHFGYVSRNFKPLETQLTCVAC